MVCVRPSIDSGSPYAVRNSRCCSGIYDVATAHRPKVPIDPVERPLPDWHEAVLLPLALPHRHRPPRRVHVEGLQVHQLAAAKARRVERLQDRPVPHAVIEARIGLGQHLLHLLVGQHHPRQLVAEPRQLEVLGRAEQHHVPPRQEAKEAPKVREPRVLAPKRQRRPRWLSVLEQVPRVPLHDRLGDLRRPREVTDCAPLDEVVQRPTAVLDRVRRVVPRLHPRVVLPRPHQKPLGIERITGRELLRRHRSLPRRRVAVQPRLRPGFGSRLQMCTSKTPAKITESPEIAQEFLTGCAPAKGPQPPRHRG
jgi:hypothetical protein